MIGPHEGKELELMLAGKKQFAMFHDAVPDDGNIDEGVIPEQAFAPYVEAGTFTRLSRDIYDDKTDQLIRYVLFSTPSEIWRASFLLWLKEECIISGMFNDPAHDEIIGHLLGVNDDDIKDFTER